MKANANYLFESSWEICNKVGGIYTVVRSKAPFMVKNYENFFMIGPYFADRAKLELSKKAPPQELALAFTELEKHGITCHYGTWNIDSSPNTILIDFKGLVPQKDDIKKQLWEGFGIDSLHSRWDFEEPILWSWAVGMLLSEVEKHIDGKPAVAQFHEWLAGFGILKLKLDNSKIKTVFTTHATMLGRSIAGHGEDLYNMLDDLDPGAKAYELDVQDKYLAERASAQEADVFTTVSEITAIEAETILGRKPDVILNNGLTIKNFPTIEETSIKHVLSKEIINEFLSFYFTPYYKFNTENNLNFFIAGRYEYKNKGLDVMIKALGKLNATLKESGSKKTISVFFWIPMAINNINLEVLENKNYFKHIKTYVQSNSNSILNRIVTDIISGKPLSAKNIFTKDFMKNLDRDMSVFKRQGNPPISTHDLFDPHTDFVMKELRNQGLDNKEDDPVKAILNPVYLTGADGMLNLPYYDALAGSHLGIFPSYYEPWGYTPVEAAALGVSAITTDLAGFGRFIEPRCPVEGLKGIEVLKRFNRTEEQIVDDLFKMMFKFANLSHSDRVKNKLVAKNLADLTDWSNFIGNYIKAHNLALER